MLRVLILIFCCGISLGGHSQRIARLEVQLKQSTFGINVPVSTNLDAITTLPDSSISLVEVTKSGKMAVACQIENGTPRTLYWLVNSRGSEKKVFELMRGKSRVKYHQVAAEKENGSLVLKSGKRSLLSYIFKTIYPPAGVDSSFQRSGFVHPLWSPHSQVLTRIQPPDHYHHFGIWNPWTHVLFRGDTVDFWNIGDKKGTVRFNRFQNVSTGSVFGEFSAIQDHVAFRKGMDESKALEEVQSIRVYQPQGDYFIVDFESVLKCATKDPFLILKYRYAGFGWRTTEQWNNKNSEVLTSEEKTRKDADGSLAKWCIVQGSVDNDYAGAVMMSSPTNYNHPEPLRIWPENQYDRGDMFANFSPTKNMDWLLEPGKAYTLKYRLLVFNGKLTAEKAQHMWMNYADPPTVTWRK